MKKGYQLEGFKPDYTSLEEASADTVRSSVGQATKDFKNSWRNLAMALQVVWKNKLYVKWGYQNFDQYTAKEVRVRKHTAMKLIRSHMFLEKEGPLCLSHDAQQGSAQEITPTLEAVETLQKAKKSLNEDEYREVKKELIDEGKDAREVKKGLKELIMKRRKDIDPEQERTRQNEVTINQFLFKLQRFKAEIKTLNILPGFIADDIEALVNKITECMPRKVIEVEQEV